MPKAGIIKIHWVSSMFLKTSILPWRKALALAGAFFLIAGYNCGNAAAEKGLFGDQPLFSDKLFSDDDDMASRLDKDVQLTASTQANRGPSIGDQVAAQISNSQVDEEFMRQLRHCSQWLQRYCVRNHSNFPGLPNDAGYAAQVQLQELVPNNPYNYGATQSYYRGVPAWFNQNGSPQTGSPVWGDDWQEHIQAQNNNRIRLSMDYSLTPAIIDQWTKEPPAQWDGQPPGTINAVGNGQGLFIVWGTGRDGHPFRNPMNGRVFIAAGSTSGTVNDQAAPNEGQ